METRLKRLHNILSLFVFIVFVFLLNQPSGKIEKAVEIWRKIQYVLKAHISYTLCLFHLII